jgi:polar amino acid transport system substrate-binding protein
MLPRNASCEGRKLFFWAAIAWFALVSTALADPIVLAADKWCPYNCEPNSDRPGVLVEIAQQVFGSAGYTVDYRLMPWNRSLSEVRRNRVQGIIGALKSEAPDLIYGSQAIACDDTGFAFKKVLGFRYNGTSSLDPYRIAVIADYNYDGGEIDAYIKKHAASEDRIQFNTGEDAGIANIRKLVAGRIDIAIDSAAVMSYIVNQLGLSESIGITHLGQPNDIFIAFSPRNSQSEELAALLDKGGEDFQRSGKLATILSRYGVSDWCKR